MEGCSYFEIVSALDPSRAVRDACRMKARDSLLFAVLAGSFAMAIATGCDDASSGVSGHHRHGDEHRHGDGHRHREAAPADAQGRPLARGAEVRAEMKVPADNPITAEKAALGKQLFFDKTLSKDSSASCSTCHLPRRAGPTGTSSRRRSTAR